MTSCEGLGQMLYLFMLLSLQIWGSAIPEQAEPSQDPAQEIGAPALPVGRGNLHHLHPLLCVAETLYCLQSWPYPVKGLGTSALPPVR